MNTSYTSSTQQEGVVKNNFIKHLFLFKMAIIFLVLERAISGAVNLGLLFCKLHQNVCNISLHVLIRWDVTHSLKKKLQPILCLVFLPFVLSKGSFLVIPLKRKNRNLSHLVKSWKILYRSSHESFSPSSRQQEQLWNWKYVHNYYVASEYSTTSFHYNSNY